MIETKEFEKHHDKESNPIDKKSSTTAARKKVAELVLTSREQGQKKKMDALNWVYLFGFTSREIIDGINGTARRGLTRTLVSKKLLLETRTGSGTPKFFYTLTLMGLCLVEAQLSLLMPYQIDAHRYRQNKFLHDLIIQKTALTAQRNGDVFITEKERLLGSQGSQKNKKQFDLIVMDRRTGKKIGIEIELDGKWDRALDTFVQSCYLSITNKEVDFIFIKTFSEAIKKRYQEAMKKGATYRTWKKVGVGKYAPVASYVLQANIPVSFEVMK